MNFASIVAILAACCMQLATGVSLAQENYPAKPVRIVVPYPPGGTTDILARVVAQHLTATLGQPVLVENRGGANGNIGSEAVAKSPPDGYTLLMGAVSPLTINPSLYPKMSFDPGKDFAPIGLIAQVPLVLLVQPAMPARSVTELVALAKAGPGSLTFGSAGNGSTQHLAGELLKSIAGIDMRHIPYKGAAPAMTDLLGGRLDLMIDLSPTALPQIASGKLRALAVTTTQRNPAAPDLPTLQEAGIEGFEVTSWFGLLAPAGTPPAIIARLNRELLQALTSAELKERFAQGAQPRATTLEVFGKQIRDETVKWAKVVRDSGARLD